MTEGMPMRRHGNGRCSGRRTILVAVLAGLAASCADIHESQDFERHRYSQLGEPRDRDDVLYFDVRFDVNYPEDNPVAETVRMQWLEAWLAQRKACTDGFEIDSARAFDPMEYNPGQYDRRYVVRCRVDAGG
jgi:hypothetical protein